MILDIFHYQYIESKEVLFKNDPAIFWTGEVHETISGITSKGRLSDKYLHLGYTRGQSEVFKRWQKYVELIDKPDWYKGQDPEHILDDRAKVSTEFKYEYPEVMREFVKSAPRFITGNKIAKIGIVIRVDKENEAIFNCLDSIAKTADYPICVLIVAQDLSLEFNERLKSTGHLVMIIPGKTGNQSVDYAMSINKAIEYYLKTDQDIRWIADFSSKAILTKPWASEMVLMFNIGGVGIINSNIGFWMAPVDIFPLIGYLNENTAAPYIDFCHRIELENLKILNHYKEA
jgi:hypothetical protein